MKLRASLAKATDPSVSVAEPPLKKPLPSGNDQKFAGVTPKPGETREFEIAKNVKMIFCWIPAGEAQLGSSKIEQNYMAKNFYTGEPPSHIDGEAEAISSTARLLCESVMPSFFVSLGGGGVTPLVITDDLARVPELRDAPPSPKQRPAAMVQRPADLLRRQLRVFPPVTAPCGG